jgi:hypothetical protein
MIWKVLGVGLEDEGPATLEALMLSTGSFIREQVSEEEAALAQVSAETLAENFIRLRVTFTGRTEPVEMRVPVGEQRDDELRALLAKPENIKGFIDQARLLLAQASEQPQ